MQCAALRWGFLPVTTSLGHVIPVWYYITPYSEVCPSARHLCSCPRVGPAP